MILHSTKTAVHAAERGSRPAVMGSVLAVIAALLMQAGLAGGVRADNGLIIDEKIKIKPAPDGYKAPEPASLGGPFELIDHTGRRVSNETYRGKWMLLYFGYTGCREACPIALENITQALQLMGPEADVIQPLFVDFSFEEPDLKGLAQFVSNFHPRLIGLTGSRAETFAIVRQFKIRRDYGHEGWSKKEIGPRIDHTTYVFLVGPDGKTRSYFYHAMSPANMVAAIREHLLKKADQR